MGGTTPNFPRFFTFFHLPAPPPLFLLRFWKEMGWATPNLPSFTYQLPAPPDSILPSEFLQRNRRVKHPFLSFFFFIKLKSKVWQVLHLQTCKDEGGCLERIVKEMKIWIQKRQTCIIKEVHTILFIMGLLY
jgi:hypothetical protein